MKKQLSLFDRSFLYDDDQLKLSPPNSTGDSDQAKVSPAKTLGDKKIQAIERYLNRTKEFKIDPKPHIQKYRPNGRKTEYYRLSYRNPWTGKQKTIHINGGNIISKLANYRKSQIQQLIDRGAALDEVLAMVEMFNSGGNQS